MKAARNMPNNAPWHIIHGEALQALREMPDASVDAVICDPPYSSGGFSLSAKSQPPEQKYQTTGTLRQYPSFGGDSRDQRSYLAWCSLWIEQCHRLLKNGGYFLSFTDWRQLPVGTDAVQSGGILWRGLIVWNKGAGARAPHKGYFKHQCEYIIWGSKGHIESGHPAGSFDGCYTYPVLQADKHHITGKPTALMRELVRCAPVGGLILDPFAGSGTTGVAALLEGKRFIGIEREAAYAAIARDRLQGAEQPLQALQQACLV